MKFWDVANYSFGHLKHRGLRTWLTLLGVVVGIAAVVLLVGLAQGLRAGVSEELELFGPDLIVILPINLEGGAFAGPTSLRPTSGKLFDKDVEVVRKTEGVDIITKAIYTNADLKFKRDSVSSTVYGMETDTYQDTMVLRELDEGRLLEPGDRKVALVGATIAYDTFDEELRANSFLEIAGEKYRVVGILSETGSSYSNVDSMIIIPFEDAQRIAGNTIADREVSAIRLKISEGYEPLEVEENIEWALMKHRGVTEDDKDFSMISARFIQEQVDSILGALTVFLMIVSGISLLVGAIGISNTMFMSVLERTREIGVLKSIGATSKQIQDVFLMEASMIGVSGGVLGLVVGALLVELVIFFGFDAVISLEMAAVAFIVSVGVGIIAGTIPAKNASKVPAIEALRYE
ncbi:FtsX-like permease family protein [Candidatus Micrarchaeota archaeon]|nr:FtsX-like permease family protein [Candidatus Micrarchaeota archaeon]